MKKIHTYVLLTAFTGLSACSGSTMLPEPDEPSPAAIAYNVGVASRAATVYNAKTQIDGFNVKALTDGGAPYITCDYIKKQADGSYAEADGFTRYWPAAGTRIGFFASVGIDPDKVKWLDDGGRNTGVVISDYKVASEVTDQVDLLVANTGLLTSGEASSTVSLTFRHALSQIVFRARNVNPALDVEITGIGLKHIQNTRAALEVRFADGPDSIFWNLGEIDKEDDPEKPTFKIDLDRPVWLHGTTEALADPSLTADLSVATDPKYIMYMIPQTLVPFHTTDRPHGSSVMLCVNIWNVADDDGIHDDNDKKIWGNVDNHEGEWMMIPCSDTWLPGRRYIYTVTFGAEGSAGGYQEKEDKWDKDRVFDPIGFDVTIEPWLPGGDIVQNIY